MIQRTAGVARRGDLARTSKRAWTIQRPDLSARLGTERPFDYSNGSGKVSNHPQGIFGLHRKEIFCLVKSIFGPEGRRDKVDCHTGL
jgi:hypothetical protein